MGSALSTALLTVNRSSIIDRIVGSQTNVDETGSRLLGCRRMLKTLVSLMMLFLIGASLAGSCEHHSVSHEETSVSAQTSNASSDLAKGASAPASDCCQAHCSQYLSLLPNSSHFVGHKDPAIFLLRDSFTYSDPSLALLTRPPLAV